MCVDVLLSLCIPTNGVLEWVIPVLESIYSEKKPSGNFEVIVTDNGNNIQFKEKMKEYEANHPNLVYRETEAVQFANQIEAFKLAKGRMIKFLNHRMKLLPDSLNYLLSVVKNHDDEKPEIFFANGSLKDARYSSFDEYVNGLSYYSSWSGGTAVWKSDFEKMDLSKPFNKLFPHINMVFNEKDKKNYWIDNRVIMEQIETDETKKGQYDLFNAFAVEYLAVILDLYRGEFITVKTFVSIKKELLSFIVNLYTDYIVLKKPCSYDLSGYRSAVGVFYSNGEIIKMVPIKIVEMLSMKVLRIVRGKK